MRSSRPRRTSVCRPTSASKSWARSTPRRPPRGPWLPATVCPSTSCDCSAGSALPVPGAELQGAAHRSFAPSSPFARPSDGTCRGHQSGPPRTTPPPSGRSHRETSNHRHVVLAGVGRTKHPARRLRMPLSRPARAPPGGTTPREAVAADGPWQTYGVRGPFRASWSSCLITPSAGVSPQEYVGVS